MNCTMVINQRGRRIWVAPVQVASREISPALSETFDRIAVILRDQGQLEPGYYGASLEDWRGRGCDWEEKIC